MASITAGKRLETVSRELLARYDADRHTGAYRDLEPILERVRVALDGIPARRTTAKKDSCLICGESVGDRDAIPRPVRWLAKKLKAGLAHARCAKTVRETDRAVWSWGDEFNRTRAKIQFDLAKADQCVCGHKSGTHYRDELENLLQCNRCNCDHFRMMGTGETLSRFAAWSIEADRLYGPGRQN